jgi:hypothetical protein
MRAMLSTDELSENEVNDSDEEVEASGKQPPDAYLGLRDVKSDSAYY